MFIDINSDDLKVIISQTQFVDCYVWQIVQDFDEDGDKETQQALSLKTLKGFWQKTDFSNTTTSERRIRTTKKSTTTIITTISRWKPNQKKHSQQIKFLVIKIKFWLQQTRSLWYGRSWSSRCWGGHWNQGGCESKQIFIYISLILYYILLLIYILKCIHYYLGLF